MNLKDAPWKNLIELYAATPVRDIGANPAYQNLCRQYVEKDGFPAARNQVEKIAIHVQNRMGKALGSTEETVAGLGLLKRTRAKPDEMKIYLAMIMQGYGLKWPAEQKDYFEKGYEKLSLPYDFFFSFSTRFEHIATENPVNNAYKHFILRVLTPTDWEVADKSKENLLAKAVYTLMAEKKGHKGFYFPYAQYDNAFVEEKLDKGLRESHVFVQMVQNVMFRPPVTGENYCYFEFERAHRHIDAERQVEHRMLFVVAERQEAFIELDDVYPDYESWFLHIIKRKDVPYLPEVSVPLDADARSQQIKALIEQKLVDLIDTAWDRLISGVPV